MPSSNISLGFFKLNVADLEEGLAFWSSAFGFAVTDTYDLPDFKEYIMALPGQEAGPNLMLLQYKDGRDVSVGPGHGPVGFSCDDIVTTVESAISAGATVLMEITEVAPGLNVAMLRSPQGHEVELVQQAG